MWYLYALWYDFAHHWEMIVGVFDKNGTELYDFCQLSKNPLIL